MKTDGLKRACPLVVIAFLCSCTPARERLPNIILIVADDLGWKDAGFMGSDYYETPNLDRLAGEGVIFNQAYAPAANCAPSRACLMSGRYAPAHGVYTVGSSERGDARTRRLIPAPNTDTLHPRFITLAESLRAAGYTTCTMGKWHLGRDPATQGMDLNVGGSIWGHPGSYFAPFGQPDLDAPDGVYLTDYLTCEACTYIRQNRDRPFFLYLPFYAVHTPLQSKEEFEQKYLEKGGAGCQSNASYAGMVDNLDRCIGLIMNELEQSFLRERTLVIFTSDNGGIRSVSCQDPLRAGKGSYYEGGIRVPLIFSWPGTIEPGRTLETPVIHLDFYPTLLELTEPFSDGPVPAGTPDTGESLQLDGVSLWPLIDGEADTIERSLYFHFPVYLQAYRPDTDDGRDPLFRTRPGSVIRQGQWKLHYYYEDQGTELYNLSEDPGERNDLSKQLPLRAGELLGRLRSWLEEQNAPVEFESNPRFEPEFEQKALERAFTP